MRFSAQGLHARRFKTWRSISALILREMATSYGRSPGGYLWAVLEPVGGLAVMTIAFSLAFRSPALGNNFPLFYATGFLTFQMYSDLSAKLGQAIRFSKPLLFYPAVTYADAIIARFLLNALTHLMVFYILMAGIMWFFETGSILNYNAILNSLGMSLSLGLGIGTLNCFLLTRFFLVGARLGYPQPADVHHLGDLFPVRNRPRAVSRLSVVQPTGACYRRDAARVLCHV
ncbi:MULTISPECIES: ABC transporter permease [unclassified Aliiroseovarius]|uniref:ABC transporter permease n=1 Tax=unclassified Aliiroseovarius TaxID=2623558 RepID=UPI00352CDC99